MLFNLYCSPLSEYQKFMFAWLWCWSRHPRHAEQAASRLLADFAPLTNFALFGLHEKLVAVDLGVPLGQVLNGLRKSM